MSRVYLADSRLEQRSAPRLQLLDLEMEVVGEAADWSTTLAQAPTNHPELLLLEWELLPNVPDVALEELQKVCPSALVIILIGFLDAGLHAALPNGAMELNQTIDQVLKSTGKSTKI
jgi:hypothetical protein